MNPIDPLPPGSPAEQADYWLALLNSPLLDQASQAAFEQWLAAKPENRQAWEKSRLFWQQMDTLTLNASQTALLEQAVAAKPPTRFNIGLNTWRLPAFACLLLAVWLGASDFPAPFADYRTAKGELKSITLSDGSLVLLNTDSSLTVDYTSGLRKLSLQGQAYFKVAADAQRPFEVETQSGRVRALGTAFEVQQLAADMAVTVYEHSVRVAFSHGESIASLQAGQRIALRDNQLGALENVNLSQSQAWQTHLLVFKEQTLQQVINELNRYRPGKIIIRDPSLAEHLVSGVFDASDPDAALTAIEKTLAAKEFRLFDSWVFLSGS